MGNVWDLSKNKTKRLEEALKQAEELHKSVNMLLEWLSDAEMKKGQRLYNQSSRRNLEEVPSGCCADNQALDNNHSIAMGRCGVLGTAENEEAGGASLTAA